jgi:hypothetical protein
VLPGSGLVLSVGDPTSADELFVLETALEPPLAMLELARRVVRVPGGEGPDWDRLPATDLGAVALTIRRGWLGDALSARGECPDPSCRQAVDVTFSIGAYIDHHRPRLARGAEPAGEPGWYQLRGTTVRFRAPLVADLLGARETDHALAVLTDRCVTPTDLSASQARRIDRALSALSPPLDGVVSGVCPECGRAVMLGFEPCGFVLAELREEFAAIYLETHLIAASYGWDEAVILGLPRARRRRYAGLAAQERAAA